MEFVHTGGHGASYMYGMPAEDMQWLDGGSMNSLHKGRVRECWGG